MAYSSASLSFCLQWAISLKAVESLDLEKLSRGHFLLCNIITQESRRAEVILSDYREQQKKQKKLVNTGLNWEILYFIIHSYMNRMLQ